MTRHSRSLFAKRTADLEPHLPELDVARCIDSLRAGRAPDLPARLLGHVENCSHCQGQILDVLFFMRDPRQETDAEAIRKMFPARKRGPAWLPAAARIAAAACAFILLLTLYFALSRRQVSFAPAAGVAGVSTPPAAAPSVPALPARGPENAGAGPSPAAAARNGGFRQSEKRDAFAVNTNLESMVGSRSRGLTIEVYSPPNQVTLGQGITFRWKEFSREPLSLTIVNNRNETIFSHPASGGIFQFNAALAPGCYYWKLESATDLYYVGKFFYAAKATFPEE